MRRTTASTGRDVPSPTFPPPSAQMFSVERRAVAATTSYDVYDEGGGYVACCMWAQLAAIKTQRG